MINPPLEAGVKLLPAIFTLFRLTVINPLNGSIFAFSFSTDYEHPSNDSIATSSFYIFPCRISSRVARRELELRDLRGS